MTRFRLALILFAALLTVPAHADKVRLLAIVPASDRPLDVSYLTPNERKRQGNLFNTGLLPLLINLSVQNARNKPLEAELNATLADFERLPALRAAIERSFAARADAFDITVTTDRGRYLSERWKLNSQARDAGFAYVLILESSFTGLWMSNPNNLNVDELSPAQTLEFRLIDVKKTSGTLAKGKATGHGRASKPVKEAVRDREFFTTVWPDVCSAVIEQVFWQLSRDDALHVMAGSVGRGAEFPAVGTLLDTHADSFKFDLLVPENWHEVKLATPYARVVEPRGPLRDVMGVRFDVDLLLPELGNGVSTIDDYVPIYDQRRQAASGATPLESFSDITAPDFSTWSFERSQGGRSIVLIRKLDDLKLQVVEVVFLKDFASLYPKYRAKIESTIAGSRIKLRT